MYALDRHGKENMFVLKYPVFSCTQRKNMIYMQNAETILKFYYTS